MNVLVVRATTAAQTMVMVEMPPGATIAQALAAAEAQSAEFSGAVSSGAVGVWGRLVGLSHPLQDGDRVEVYEPIRADAKALRRERARLTPAPRRRSAS